MTERGGNKPTYTMAWRTGGSPHPWDEPDEKRALGFYNGTGAGDGDILTAEHLNWLIQAEEEILAWLRTCHVREFQTLAEAITACSVPDRFVVHAASYLKAMGELLFTSYGGAGASTGSNNYIFYPCTDGVRIYYHEGEPTESKIYAANPETGATLWGPITVGGGGAGTGATGLCCDGNRVFFTCLTDTLALYSLDPSDGSAVGSSDTSGLGITFLRSNGVYVIGLDEPNDRCHVHSDVSGGSGEITYDGYASWPEYNLSSIGLDHDQGYMVGDRGAAGTYDVVAFVLSSRSTAWSLAFATSERSYPRAVVSDGVTVFVSTQRHQPTAGGYATVYAINRLDGSVLWTADTGVNAMLHAIACDDYWLYVGNEVDNSTHVLDKRTGRIVLEIDGHVTYAADGVSSVGQGGTLSPNGDMMTRHHRGGPGREFQRVAGDDDNRHPFYTLAVPMHERP